MNSPEFGLPPLDTDGNQVFFPEQRTVDLNRTLRPTAHYLQYLDRKNQVVNPIYTSEGVRGRILPNYMNDSDAGVALGYLSVEADDLYARLSMHPRLEGGPLFEVTVTETPKDKKSFRKPSPDELSKVTSVVVEAYQYWEQQRAQPADVTEIPGQRGRSIFGRLIGRGE